jgi:hypothetical protein
MPSLDAPNVAPSSCLTGFCALAIRQLLPLNPFHHVASRKRSTRLPLPSSCTLRLGLKPELGLPPETPNTCVDRRSSLSVALNHLSLLAVDPIGRPVSQTNRPLRKTHSRFTPSTYDSACSPSDRPAPHVAQYCRQTVIFGSAWQPGSLEQLTISHELLLLFLAPLCRRHDG